MKPVVKCWNLIWQDRRAYIEEDRYFIPYQNIGEKTTLLFIHRLKKITHLNNNAFVR
jgi:hypothetical protein